MKKEAKGNTICIVILGIAGLIVAAYIVTAGIQMILPATDSPMPETLIRLKDALLSVMPLIAAACTGVLLLESGEFWAE